MNIYVWAIVFLSLYALVGRFIPNKKNSKKLTIFLSSAHLFFIQAFRSSSVGGDIIHYENHYNYIKNFFIPNLSLDNIIIERFEPGYVILEILSINFNISFQGFMMLISFFHFAVLSYVFYKYSENVYISYVLYMVLGIYDFGFSGLRQLLAMTFVLLSFKSIDRKNKRNFLFFIIVAYSFHRTAIVFIILYLITNTKFKYLYRRFFPVLFIFFLLFNQQVGNFLATIFNESYVSVNSLVNFNAMDIIVITILVLGFVIEKLLKKRNKDTPEEIRNSDRDLFNNLLTLTSLATLLQLLSLNSYYFVRLNLYLYSFIALFTPLVLNYYFIYFSHSNRIQRFFLKYIFIIIFFTLMLSLYIVIMSSNPHLILPHQFVWE